MPFGDSLPLSLLSSLIFFHLSLAHSDRLMQTASGALACRRRRRKVIYTCKRRWLTHTGCWRSRIHGDAWPRAHIPPFPTSLFPRRRAGNLEHLLWTNSTKTSCQSVLQRKLGVGGKKKAKSEKVRKGATVGVQWMAPWRWSGIERHN